MLLFWFLKKVIFFFKWFIWLFFLYRWWFPQPLNFCPSYFILANTFWLSTISNHKLVYKMNLMSLYITKIWIVKLYFHCIYSVKIRINFKNQPHKMYSTNQPHLLIPKINLTKRTFSENQLHEFIPKVNPVNLTKFNVGC